MEDVPNGSELEAKPEIQSLSFLMTVLPKLSLFLGSGEEPPS